MNYEKSVKNIRQELKNYIIENNIKSLVLGISGGIDSTLCAILAKPICDEIGIPLIGRSLPTSSNSNGENSRAKSVGEYFCTDFKEVEIQTSFDALHLMVNEDDSPIRPIQNGNIKARTRMIYLYDLASVNGGLVLSTDNWTEYLIGFFTIFGDQGDFGMIQELWKTEVYEMSEWIMINEHSPYSKESYTISSCIDADATDGLGISETDLDQILPKWKGNSKSGYKEVDNILKKYLENKFDGNDNPVIQRHLKTEYKRNHPVIIKRNTLL